MYCIYRITNKINGKTYIGQHSYQDLDDNYMGSGFLLLKAQKKYGIENFEKEILYSRIQRKDTADSMEIYAIKKEKSIGKAEYNIAKGGQGGFIVPVSEETKEKLRQINLGKKHSEETKRKIRETCKRVCNSEESRKKRSESHKGKHHSEETKRKIRDSNKGKNKGKTAWNKGLKKV